MEREFDSVNFTGVIITLKRCWQEMHTNRRRHMRFSGEFFHVSQDFVITKASHLASYPVDFRFALGSPEQHKVEHGIGKFAYHGDIAGGLINAWYTLFTPEPENPSDR